MLQEDFNDLAKELLSLNRENEWIEFKLNYTEPQNIGEYLSALSNSACLFFQRYGYLIFGIDDNTKKAVGTKFNPNNEKIGSQPLENWLITQLEPKIDFQIIEGIYNDKKLVILKIESAKFSPVKFKGLSYIRINSCKKKLSDHPEKERKIWNITSKISFEEDIALEKIEEDKIFELLDYPAYFDLMKLRLPDNREGIISKFIKEKIILKNHSKYDITNLGAILFAKKLLEFPKLKRKSIRVIVYGGKDKLKTIKEYSSNQGYALDFANVIKYTLDQLPTNEIIEKALRKIIYMYPEIAIRELVANTIVHQDFSERGTSPMVEIYYDRIEFINPGKPLISTNRFIDHPPQSRNELLASFLRRINVCEERGSGVDKVINAVEVYQLPAPNFVVENNFMKVILFAHKTLRKMNKEDKIRACYQHSCLKYVSNDSMTNETLRKRFSIDDKNYPMASRIIKDTLDADLIKKHKGNAYLPFWA